MTGSMKAVGDDFISVNKAADEFGVPRSTLKDKLSGKVAHGARSGPNPYLSGVDYELVKFLFTCTPTSVYQRQGSRPLALCGRQLSRSKGQTKDSMAKVSISGKAPQTFFV